MRCLFCLIFSFVSFYAWSGNSDALLEITHGPYLQHLTENEVTIVWTTSKPCKSWVEYAEKNKAGFYSGVPQTACASENGLYRIDTIHRIHIRGLNAHTTYLYRVLSQEVKELRPYRPLLGETVSTNILKNPLEFQTNPANANTVAFSMLNDVHNNKERLSALLNMAPPAQVDFMVYNGDMCNYVNTQKDLFDGFLDLTIKNFASGKPFVYVRGNHETRGSFSRSLMPYLGGPDGKFYYGFRYGPVYFIVLDCGEDKPDSDVEYAGLTDFDHYIQEQGGWLKQALNLPECKQADFRVVLAHIPFTLEGWYGYERLRKNFLPLLQQANINLMLSGHTHQFGFYDRNDQISFPLIVNSNNSVLTLRGNTNKMKVKVTQEDGKILLEKEFTK